MKTSNVSQSDFFFRSSCLVFAALAMLALRSTAFGATEAEATLTKVGQMAPAFSVTTLDGKEFSLEANRGRVVLVNFFATWCGPCLAELPHVEKDIWQEFKDRGLVVLAVGREHQNTELAEFQKQKMFTFPMAGDPKRGTYSKFALEYIPRTYLINREGKIVYQHVGYRDGDTKELVAMIDKEIGAKTAPTK
jgi:peroxiredoxin